MSSFLSFISKIFNKKQEVTPTHVEHLDVPNTEEFQLPQHFHEPAYPTQPILSEDELNQRFLHEVKQRDRSNYCLCDYCWMKFATEKTYLQHIESAEHKKKLMYLQGTGCDICYVTVDPSSMVSHERGKRHQRIVYLAQVLPDQIPGYRRVHVKSAMKV